MDIRPIIKGCFIIFSIFVSFICCIYIYIYTIALIWYCMVICIQ